MGAKGPAREPFWPSLSDSLAGPERAEIFLFLILVDSFLAVFLVLDSIYPEIVDVTVEAVVFVSLQKSSSYAKKGVFFIDFLDIWTFGQIGILSCVFCGETKANCLEIDNKAGIEVLILEI